MGAPATGSEERYFILLDDREEGKILRQVLKSPLALAKEIVHALFSGLPVDNLSQLSKKRATDIPDFAAGLARSESLKGSYPLADYHQAMFRFQQWFHSSYRARQGKVLEQILASYCQQQGYQVFTKKKTIHEEIRSLFQTEKSLGSDLDLALRKGRGELILIQIRSRDDTGGTTAKASLIDALNEVLQIGSTPAQQVVYAIVVWESQEEAQYETFLKKLAQSLKVRPLNEDGEPISDDELLSSFKEKARSPTGLEIQDKIYLKIAYGTHEIERLLAPLQNQRTHLTLQACVDRFKRWDDLWLAYAIASLELNQACASGKTNVEYLKAYIEASNEDLLTEQVDTAAQKIFASWQADTLPFRVAHHNYLYIRDLLYMYHIYSKTGQKRGQRKNRSPSLTSQPTLWEAQKPDEA
ncbi:MAG: hypothetical protein N2045_04145 [Fimbriimonadales bacterium]|nr:hypothetical protein [Fimbriimonadales bacterium]